MKDLNFISPFKKLCITIGNLPTAYIESMSYYEGLTFLVNYLANNVIPAVNNNSEVVQELQTKYVELKNYVDNYFDNLDVQEEINNKLDEMADNGYFNSIFLEYLPYVTPEMFGAKGDGTTDDTSSIEEAIDYATTNNVPLHFKNVTYAITSLLIDNPIIIEGNNCILKSYSATESYVIKLENSGITKSIIKDLKIDGNSQNLIGLYVYTYNYQDCYSIIENIEVYNCQQHGIYITGNSGLTSIRELKLIKCIEHHNLNGIYADSMSDSYIINNTAFENMQHGIYLKQTGSIKISDSKCFMNGKETNDTLPLERIPASAFAITADATPITGKNYYTRSGNGNWQTPYTFTLFTGSSFTPGTDYYEYSGLYQLHGHGIYLQQCDSVVLSNIEVQANAGDGINCYQCYNISMVNILGHINGYMWDNSYNPITYANAGLQTYYYGVYLDTCNFINIEGNFFNQNTGVLGYIQRSSVYTKGGNNITLNLSARVLTENVEFKNITLSTFNCKVNGNPINIPINLSNITLNADYSIIENNWNGSWLYVKDNVLYFNLVINNNNGFTVSGTPTTIGSFSLVKPILFNRVCGACGTNYADNFDGQAVLEINKNGSMLLSTTTAGKYATFSGSYIF